MELMIVITIIVTLAGMITVGVSIGGKAMRKTKTVALVGNLNSALITYRQTNGAYPGERTPDAYIRVTPQDLASNPTLNLNQSTSWKSLYADTSGKMLAFDAGAGTYSNPEQRWQVIAHALRAELASAGDTAFPNLLADPTTGASIRYRPARFYPFAASAPASIDGEQPPNQDTVQLWAIGEDGSDQAGDGDDLTNWKQ